VKHNLTHLSAAARLATALPGVASSAAEPTTPQTQGGFIVVKLTVGLTFTAAAVLLVGCSGYRHEIYRGKEKSTVSSPKYELHFVEADDEGWFWEPEQANRALEAVEASAARRNTFVLLFVHGWHHSASCCDSNVESFKKTLVELYDELAQPVYRRARGETSAAPSDEFTLIGIYLGWRGRSLWGWFDYLSFWGRKSAAERVGETDAKEFIARLNRVYLEHPENHPQHFLGLISIGHSFGGQVLMRAAAGKLEQQFIDLKAPLGYLRQTSPTPPSGDKVALQGIGDLVILINPATEAAAYHRLHLLSMGLRYENSQTPVMLTFSAENDWARHKAFTTGRVLGEFFTGKPRKEDPAERETERIALGINGKHVRHVTHTISPADTGVRLIDDNIAQPAEEGCETGTCIAEWMKWQRPSNVKADDTERIVSQLSTFDFSTRLSLGDVTLEPGEGAIPYQPLIVATASEAIIDDHSGIFTEPFLQFLIPYIALVESKIASNPATSDEKKRRAR
jgi:hypothetical protein